jgi:hypothetical protein
MTTRVQSHCDGGLGTRAVAEWEGAAKARQCPPRIGFDPVGSLAARLRCPIHEPRHQTPGRAQRGTRGSSLLVDLPKPKKFISTPNKPRRATEHDPDSKSGSPCTNAAEPSPKLAFREPK